MSSEPPDALVQDAESTPIMKPAGAAAVPAPTGEIDAPRTARTVPRPGGPISSRRPINAPPRPAPVTTGGTPVPPEPSPPSTDDGAPTVRTPDIAALADPADDEAPGVESFLAALAAAKKDPPAEPVEEAGALKRRSRRTVKTADEAPQSKVRSGDAPLGAPPPAPAEPAPAAATVPSVPAALDEGSAPAPVDEGSAPGKSDSPRPPRPAPPRPRAPAALSVAADESAAAAPEPAPAPPQGGGGAPREDASARPAVETPAPAPAEDSEPIRPMRIISIGSWPPPAHPEPPAPPPAIAAAPPLPAIAAAPPSPPPPIAATPAALPPSPADPIDDEASWDDAASGHPSRPPLHASMELETFVAPPPPAVPAMSPPPAALPPKPPAVEEVEAIADEEEPPAAAAKPDEIVSIPDDDIVADRISEIDPISGHDEGHDEIVVDMEEPAPLPKKPPPPPKRPTSIEPPAAPAAATRPTSIEPPAVAPLPSVIVTAPQAPPPVSVRQVEAAPPAPPPPPPSSSAVAVVAAAPMAAPTLDLGKKRTKPWWEEIFSDDFIRTLEKVEPKAIRKECDFIEERLGLEKGAVMLDLCCGNGAHAVELASRGYNVVGYDLSLAMLARAQDEALDRGQRINFLQGDVREMAFDEAFDGMYSWSTSFGYFEDDKNLNVLSRIHRGLRKGGIFLLDVINRDYVCPRQPSLVWFEGDGCVCMDEMFVDFFSSRLRVKRTVMFEDGRSRECDYSIRLYGLHELGKMLHETGFKVLEVTGHPAHPGVFFGSESPRIIVLAERA